MIVARRAAVAAALALLLAVPAASAAPGDLDPSFGGDGVVQARPAGSSEAALYALALSGGRVVAVGTEFSDDGCNDPMLGRWLADGTPDPAFGTGGVAVTPVFACDQFASHVARPLDVVVAPDGSAITGGDTGGQSAGNDGEIVTSHTAAGALDTSFGGGDGFVHYGDYFHGNVNAVVRLAGGGIAAAGGSYGLRNSWALSRYEADGDRDASFGGGDGYVQYAPDGDQGVLQAAVADGADGALVVVGNLYGPSYPGTPAIARVLADGSLDPAFGVGGITRVPIAADLEDVAATSDGGFMTAGWTDGSPSSWLLLKFDAEGRLDETFGAMGRVDGPPGNAVALAIDAEDRIVAAGRTPGSPMAAARFLSNGAPDETFGAGGLAELPIDAPSSFGRGAEDVAVQPDGRVVLGGTGLLGGQPAFTVARLRADGADEGGSARGGQGEGDGSSDGEIGTGDGTGPVDAGPIANRQGSGGSVTIRILNSRVTKRGVLVRITYPRGTEGTARARLWTRNKGVLLGQRTVVVLKGTTSRRFRVPLNRRAKRMLRSGKRLKVRATVRVTGLPAR
ncbi:MAG TPA: hypothetical protein VF587_03865 [Solirubrobacteraceae bacterium]